MKLKFPLKLFGLKFAIFIGPIDKCKYQKKWNKKHKEERRLYRKEWYQENRPRINILQNEYKKRRYATDPEYREVVKARNKAWYEKRGKEYQRAYYRKRKELEMP